MRKKDFYRNSRKKKIFTAKRRCSASEINNVRINTDLESRNSADFLRCILSRVYGWFLLELDEFLMDPSKEPHAV